MREVLVSQPTYRNCVDLYLALLERYQSSKEDESVVDLVDDAFARLWFSSAAINAATAASAAAAAAAAAAAGGDVDDSPAPAVAAGGRGAAQSAMVARFRAVLPLARCVSAVVHCHYTEAHDDGFASPWQVRLAALPYVFVPFHSCVWFDCLARVSSLLPPCVCS